MTGPSGLWETQSQKALIRLTSSLSLQGLVHWKNNFSNFFLEEFRCGSSINLKLDLFSFSSGIFLVITAQLDFDKRIFFSVTI